jgi:AAA domain-containing protein
LSEICKWIRESIEEYSFPVTLSNGNPSHYLKIPYAFVYFTLGNRTKQGTKWHFPQEQRLCYTAVTDYRAEVLFYLSKRKRKPMSHGNTKQPAVPPSGWIIEHVLPATPDHTYAVVGEAGVGKTFLLTDWALSIASGTAWCGHAVKQQAVLCVRPDRDMVDFYHRGEAWSSLHPHANLERGIGEDTLFEYDLSFQQEDPTALDAIARHARSCNATVIILDECAFLGWSLPDAAQYLQELLHAVVLYTRTSTRVEETDSAFTYRLRRTYSSESQWEQSMTLFLPHTSFPSSINLAMIRVATPGFAVDSFGESCVVLQPA